MRVEACLYTLGYIPWAKTATEICMPNKYAGMNDDSI